MTFPTREQLRSKDYWSEVFAMTVIVFICGAGASLVLMVAWIILSDAPIVIFIAGGCFVTAFVLRCFWCPWGPGMTVKTTKSMGPR